MARAKKEVVETTDLGALDMSSVAVTGQIAPFEDDMVGFYQKRNKTIPDYATEFSAGFDLSVDIEAGDVINKYDHRNQKIEITARGQDNAPARLYLEPGDRALVPTGLHADIPEGYYIAIHARSGTSWKQGLILTNGVAVIDADYVGEIFISVTNNSGTRVVLEDGERIAQGLLMPAVKAPFKRLDTKPAQKTSRAGGFGSTGSK